MLNSDHGHAGTLICRWSRLPAKVESRVTAAEPADTAGRRAQFLSGGHEQIAPTLADVPELFRTLVLYRERDAARCVVSLEVDLPALDATATAVNSTDLLPGKDPGQLTGPDRVDVHHVTNGARQ